MEWRSNERSKLVVGREASGVLVTGEACGIVVERGVVMVDWGLKVPKGRSMRRGSKRDMGNVCWAVGNIFR